MTIKQCYQAMGADFEEISQRIPSEAMIRKFAVKFPEDKSFAELTKALEQGDVETAFRAAHTIKGLCLTLGFSHLTAPASELTELLRAGRLDGSEVLYGQLAQAYNITVELLRAVDLPGEGSRPSPRCIAAAKICRA